MKIDADQSALAAAAAWCAHALPARPVTPVLTAMRLEAEGDSLTLAAFDYDTAATATIKVNVGEPGTVLLPGRLLTEITRSLPDRAVTITTDGSRAVLACGPATFTLPSLPVEDYPALPAMPAEAGTIGSEALAAAVAQATAAAGRDDTLPALTGALLDAAGATLTLVCTDRYRLAVREVAWQPVLGGEGRALIPARAIAAAAKAMTGGDVVTVCLGEGMAGFAGDGRTLVTRQIGGDFPQWARLVPAEFTATATVDGGVLAEAVKRAALVIERNTAVRLTFTPGSLQVAAGTGDGTGAQETMDAGWEAEEPFTIAFSPAYLLDGLTALGPGQVSFGLTGEGKPALLTGAQEGLRYLLMPIRLGS